MSDCYKPPLGLRNREMWELERMVEISQAIQRYTAAYYPIPENWIAEYNELAKRIGEGKA